MTAATRMSDSRLLHAALCAVLLAAISPAAAQTPASPKPAAPKPAAKPAAAAPLSGKIAVINTAAFQSESGGIAVLAAGFGTVGAEFEPKRQELIALNTRMTALQNELNAMAETPDAAARQAKTAEIESLRQEMQKQNEDAQAAYQKRMEESVGPLFQEVGRAMEEFAKKKGVAVLLDTAKLRDAIYVIGDSLDLTTEFIADYNKSHPAPPRGAAAAPPAPPPAVPNP